MGVSTNDPIMSWVDLTSSPVYTSASTSGTSGCKNWEFSQYLERTRRQFIKKSQRQLLVETVQGWEILQAANGELVAPDTYRIGKLLRGQYGTDHVLGETVPAGARVIYLAQGWQNHATSPDLRGNVLAFTVEANGREAPETFTLDYQANHLRPLSPVHIKAAQVGTNINISWIRRTRVGGDDWAALDVPLGEDNERYEVDFLNGGGAVVLTKETTTQSLIIPVTELETVLGIPLGEISLKVYQMSVSYGRGASRFAQFEYFEL